VTHDLTRETLATLEGLPTWEFCNGTTLTPEEKSHIANAAECVREVAALRRQVEDARRTAEYWKAEHLAANAENATLRAKAETLQAQSEKMLAAINWACGAGDSDFEEPEHATRYWWRKHLHNKAGLEYDRETFSYAQARAAQEPK
jgi:hypothetical protein